MLTRLTRRGFAKILLGVSVGHGFLPRSAVAYQTDADLIDHASDVFVGRIDILIAVGTDGSDYSVLVVNPLKGTLTAQSLVVVRETGDPSLNPGDERLFFVRFEPNVLRYQIVEMRPVPGPDELSRLAGTIEESTCGLTDVLTLDGVMYARRNWNGDKHYLEREWVGPSVATVALQDTSATACRTDLEDRSASRIPARTRIQKLKGYATTFRVAVRLPDRHRYLYEAIWNKNAKTGEDLLDIRDRVVEVTAGRYSFCNDRGCVDFASFPRSDTVFIRGAVAQVLQAPVETPRYDPGAIEEEDRGYFYFRLNDGSTTGFDFNIIDGYGTNGIQLPDLLLKTILRGYDIPEGF